MLKNSSIKVLIYVSLFVFTLVGNKIAKAEVNSDVLDQYGQQEAGYGMDYDGVNPGEDKRCLSYKECPEWDGNPDTKVFYDLMKLPNGTGLVQTDFNWNLHVYLCHINKELDSINGEGSFEKRAIQSAKDGMIPCPIGVNPNWTYDWELHILKAKLKRLTMLWPKTYSAGPMAPTAQPSLLNSTDMVE